VVGRADEAVFLHPLDPLGRGVVAHAHLALEPAGRGLLAFEHDLAGLAVLAFFRIVRAAVEIVEAEAAVFRLLGDRIDIFGLALRAPEIGDGSTSSSDTNGPWTRLIGSVLGL
jgi:hypothetical protein